MSNEYSQPSFLRCGKKIRVGAWPVQNGSYGCCESGYKMKDCPRKKANVRQDKQVATNEVGRYSS